MFNSVDLFKNLGRVFLLCLYVLWKLTIAVILVEHRFYVKQKNFNIIDHF